jgi:hypothetical protein
MPVLSDDTEPHCVTRNLQMTGYSRVEAVFLPTAQCTAIKYVSHIIMCWQTNWQLHTNLQLAVRPLWSMWPHLTHYVTIGGSGHQPLSLVARKAFSETSHMPSNLFYSGITKSVAQRNLLNALSNSYSLCLWLLTSSVSQFIAANILNKEYLKVKKVKLSLRML